MKILAYMAKCVIKLKILRGGAYTGWNYLGGSNVITQILIRGSQEGHSRWRCYNAVGTGMVQHTPKNSGGHQKLKEAKNRFLP